MKEEASDIPLDVTVSGMNTQLSPHPQAKNLLFAEAEKNRKVSA
jgi:hypothetical protein